MALHNHLPELLGGNGELLATQPLRAIFLEKTLAKQAVDCLKAAGLTPKNVTLVADQATYAVLGKRLEAELSATMHVNALLFQETPYADITHATQVREAAHASDLIIAVGSGTINDLCKYAAFLLQKPFVVFPTAPSMNGYVSATASILKAGHKYSLAAALPVGIFCDLEVLANAPYRLIRSGFGDVLSRSTAQADWLLSHHLFETPYSALPFELLRPYEVQLTRKAAKLREGDQAALVALVKAILVSGIGMVLAHGSYPASQGEHSIAHCMEMMQPHDGHHSYHGEQIAITSLTMSAVQDTYLAYVPGALHKKNPEDAIADYFGLSLRDNVRAEYARKALSDDMLAKVNQRIMLHWPKLAQAISAVRIPTERLRTLLKAADCPLIPEDIGWNAGDYEQAVAHAHFIRNRFTFLDLAYLNRAD